MIEKMYLQIKRFLNSEINYDEYKENLKYILNKMTPDEKDYIISNGETLYKKYVENG